jgi:hypothetical protein
MAGVRECPVRPFQRDICWPVLTTESKWTEIDWKAQGYDFEIRPIREKKV